MEASGRSTVDLLADPAALDANGTAPRHARAALGQVLNLAANGMHVFPVAPGEKSPATARGFKDATTDEAVIRVWHEQSAAFNWAIATGPSGLIVIDIDGPDGDAAWAVLQIENDEAPPTYEVTTPRGGRHIYFRGSAPSSVGRLGPQIDVRSTGGYVLAPPSVIGRNPYRVRHVRPVEEAPAWLVLLLGTKHEAREADPNLILDTPSSLSRARDFVARMMDRVPTEGGRNDATYRLAATLADLGVSEHTAREIMAPWLEAFPCPLGEDEIERTITSGYRNRQNGVGCYAVPELTPEQTAAILAAAREASPARAPFGTDFRLFTMDELAALPEPEWLIPNQLQRHGRAMIYGPSNAGKTFAVLTYLLPLTLQGHGVIYVAGEDDKREIYRRASAWAQFNGSAAIEAMNAHFRVFPVMPLPQNQPVREFCATVQKDGFCPSVVVIDTLATAMAGLNENSAQDIQTFWGLCREIQTALDTSIFIVHHTGKDPTKDERGSSNIRAGADTTFRLSADKAAGIVAMDMRRQRNAAILKEPIIFRVRPMAGTLVYAPVDEKDRRQIVRSVGVVGEITAKFVKAISQLAAAGEPTPSLHLIAENIVPAGRRGDEPELRIGAVRAMEEKLRSYIRRQAKNGPWGPLLPYVVRDVLGAPEKPYRGRLPEDWEDADSDADLAP